MNKLDRFMKGEIVLHTPTQDIYDKLMEWCDLQGIKWITGKKATTSNIWDDYKTSTAIGRDIARGIGYCDTNFYIKISMTVETLESIDFGHFIGIDLSDDADFTARYSIRNGKVVSFTIEYNDPKVF